MHELIEKLAGFFDQGGPLLWAILALSTLMWALILERYWFVRRRLPVLRAELSSAWRDRDARAGAASQRLMLALIERLESELSRFLLSIRSLTSILPMLGLLGTVSGMIKVFEVITVFGTGNTRGMAAGISEALITTLAGLLTALPGLYLVSGLEGRATREVDRFALEMAES